MSVGNAKQLFYVVKRQNRDFPVLKILGIVISRNQDWEKIGKLDALTWTFKKSKTSINRLHFLGVILGLRVTATFSTPISENEAFWHLEQDS